MKFLTKSECLNWLKQCAFAYPVADPAFSFHVSLPILADSGHKVGFMQKLMAWLPRDVECLLFVTAWGIWPSSEHPGLAALVRRGLGTNRPLHDAPGHVFAVEERHLLECVLLLSLYSFWDAVLADAGHRCLVRLSHDEMADIDSVDDLSLQIRNAMGLS